MPFASSPQSVFLHAATYHNAHGWSLSELLVVLALVTLGASTALPPWQTWQERQQILAARERLRMDLQVARIQAMQTAQVLSLRATRDCAWHNRTATDWSCGWQLTEQTSQRALQTTALSYPLQVSFTKSTPLLISAQGHLGQVGDRWTVQSRTGLRGNIPNAQSLCLSGAGRLRVVWGATCS
jgi:Tfp pilus assembly protein FimT